MSDAIDSLLADGEGQELAGRSAYERVHLTADDADEAAKLIGTDPAAKQYLLLLALRRDAPEVYDRVPLDARATVLVDALGSLRKLNDFGYLDPDGSYDDLLGRALVELGPEAAHALRPLLDDDRRAGLAGSEVATLAKIYKPRRSDFAYRYASLALGRDPEFEEAVSQRDVALAQLRRELHGAA